MTRHGLADTERTIARCRVILSIAALIAVYIDPAPPADALAPVTGGPFLMDPRRRRDVAHLVYSVAIYVLERWRVVPSGARALRLDGRALRRGDRAVTEGPTARSTFLRVRRAGGGAPRRPPAGADGDGRQLLALSLAHPGDAPGRLASTSCARCTSRSPATWSATSASSASSWRRRCGSSRRRAAPAHRPRAARRLRAGARRHQRAARDLPPAPASGASAKALRRADGAAGEREARVRRAPPLRAVAPRSGGHARSRTHGGAGRA